MREILKAYFDDTQIDRADQYHSFFTSWKQLAGINIAAHTRPRDIRGGVLIVEADHPGWVQLLHMQKRTILRKIHREYPQLEVKEIRIVVGDGGENSDKNSNAPVELASNEHSSGESIQSPEPAAAQGPHTPPPPQALDQQHRQSKQQQRVPEEQQEGQERPEEAPEERQYKRRFEDALKELGKRVEEREHGDDTGGQADAD